MGNNQEVGRYISEEELRQEFLDLVKCKLIGIDRKLFNNQQELNYLFRVGLSEDMFVSYKKIYRSYSSYLRRRRTTSLILVKFLYNWYSNMKNIKKQVECLKKIDKHFKNIDWWFSVYHSRIGWGNSIDDDVEIINQLDYNMECKWIIVKLLYNWYSNSIL